MAMQQALDRAIPGALARWARVGFETPGAVVLLADSAAVAARLRQLSPRMLASVKQVDPEVNEVLIHVQAVHRRLDPERPQRRVAATGLTDLARLADRIEDPNLRAALRKLIARQREF